MMEGIVESQRAVAQSKPWKFRICAVAGEKASCGHEISVFGDLRKTAMVKKLGG